MQEQNDLSGHKSALNAGIGVRVRDLRENAGLTLRDLEERTGIKYSNLSGLERGKRSWLPRHMEAVAAALGVRPRDLLPDDAEVDAVRENPPAPPLRPEERELLEAVHVAGDGALRVARALVRTLEATRG